MRSRSSYLIILLAALVIAPTAQGDAVSVLSLYDTGSFVPGFLIPFKLQGSLLTSGTVTSTSITNDAGADCRIMPDPFIKNIFLVKCDAPANVNVTFNIQSGATLTPVNYGPIAVQLPGTGLTAIGSSGSGGGTASPSAQGQALFTKYGCINCHSGSMPTGASVSDIQNALATVPDMAFLKGSVSSSDEALISAYLGGT